MGSRGHVEFLRELFDAHGAAALVDVVNLHAYFETWDPSPLETLPRYLADASAVIERHGGRQALWLAEVGYSNWRAPGTPPRAPYEHTLDYQAVMLVRTLALALAEPRMSLLAWYELKDPRVAAPMIGDDNNRHLGVTFADYAPKPAFSALAFVQSLVGAGFRTADRDVTVSRSPASTSELRAFVTAKQVLVVIGWLRTAETPSNGRRHERVHVSAPYVRHGAFHVYDERGRPVAATVREEQRDDNVDFELELVEGEVRVVEQSVELRY